MAPTPWIPKSYPPARRSDHVDTYKSAAKGEVRVADPYQWLEADTEETEKWTSAQEAFTRTHLDKNADRGKLEDAFRASMDYAKVHDLLIPHRLKISRSFSSHLLRCTMMAAGTGSTIAGSNPSHVSRLSTSIVHDYDLISKFPVIYRSKGKTLPDLSQGDSAVGDIFFDVGRI